MSGQVGCTNYKSKQFNRHHAIKLSGAERLNQHAVFAEVENRTERCDLWHTVARDVKMNQTAFSLTAGGRSLYTLMETAFPRSPASLPSDALEDLLLIYVFPANFPAAERAKFQSLFCSPTMKFRESITTQQRDVQM